MESWKGNRTPSNPQEGYYVGLMNACGYRTKDLEKPVIGIVNSFTDVNPGHRAFKELVGYVKEGVWAAALSLCLLVQVLDQLSQRIHSFLLIAAVRDQCHCGVLHNAQAQHAQQALCVDAAFFFFYPDAAFELVGFLNEIGRGSGVQTDLIFHRDLPCIHEPALLTHIFTLAPEGAARRN